MKWKNLLRIVGREPVFHSSILMSGPVNPADMGRQLSRWVKSGYLIQLRRGVYTLAERFQKTTPHPFLIANRLKRASYVSLQSALEHYGLIPEHVPSITSVTTGRPEKLTTLLGNYIFKHIKKSLFSSYQLVDIGEGQSAFIARPEKALFDLLYLTPGSDNANYLQELRLENVESLDFKILIELAERSKSRKLCRAVRWIAANLKESKE
jgi:predicted transcriptional regulator of viral defense system